MKLLLVLSVIVVAVYAEYCDHTSDCKLQVCGANFRLDCWDRDNVCTCVPTAGSYYCTRASECEPAHGKCNYYDHHWHCVDNVCRCRTYNPSG